MFRSGASKAPPFEGSALQLGEYREPLRRFFLRRVRDPHEAEDLAQEVLARMVQRCTAETPENIEGFVFISAANLLRDRNRRKIVEANAFAMGPATGDEGLEELSPERILKGKQALEAVVAALNTLDRRVRDVFILNRVTGLKYAEIAAIYGLSVSSVEKYVVKAHVHLAKQKLWP